MGRRTQIKKSLTSSQIKLKQGAILCDAAKQEWHLGKPVGAGGFGQIYLASKDLEKKVPVDAPYVAKIEQLSNGPLFVEMHFYVRVAKDALIEDWKKSRGLKHLGMPKYHGFGCHVTNTGKYRFLILDRLGPDIGSIFLKNHRCLNLKTVFNLGLQILDILEFIHFYGYIHADVKGSNLLLGLGEDGQDRVYLIDYGLACLYVDRFGHHKEYIQDLRRAHDGTLEYTSRDAHVGAHSRRGDIEVLCYNMVQWLAGRLPWESDLLDPERVADMKNMYMANISLFLDQCFPQKNAPAELNLMLKYVASLSFTGKPNYDKLRGLLRTGLKAANLPDDGKLDISAPPVKLSKSHKFCSDGSDTENRRGARSSYLSRSRSGARTPCGPVQVCDRRTRQRSNAGRTFTLRSQEFDWVKVLQSHPERDAKPAATKQSKARKSRPKVVVDIAECLQKKPEDSRANPTPAMLEVLSWCKRSPSPQGDFSRRRCSRPVTPAGDIRRKRPSTAMRRYSRAETPSPVCALYTPAMEEVMRRRELVSHFNPQCTAMSSRAERMRHRDNKKYVVESDSSDDELASYFINDEEEIEEQQQQQEEEEEAPVARRTRAATTRSVITANALKPIKPLKSPRSQCTMKTIKKPSPVRAKTPTIKICRDENSQWSIRPTTPSLRLCSEPFQTTATFEPIQTRSKTPTPMLSKTPTVRSKTPKTPHSKTPASLISLDGRTQVPSTITGDLTPGRITRYQSRCGTKVWKAEHCENFTQRKVSAPAATPMRSQSTVPWANRRKISAPLLESPRKRRYSQDDDYVVSLDDTRSSSSSSVSSRLSKKTSRLPTKPRYRQRNLSGPKKRVCRREVSPSEIDFVPRLRSGKDTSDDFRVFHERSFQTAPGGVRLFAGNQRLVSSMGRPLRPFYCLASLL